MIVKRSISFFLQKVYNSADDAECQIRMRVRWNGNLLQFNCGFTIAPEKWVAETSRCKKNSFNKKGYSSADINKELNWLEGLADDVFKSFEANDVIPSKEEYKHAFYARNGKGCAIYEKAKTLDQCFIEFMSTQGTINSWTEGTIKKFRILRNHLHRFQPNIMLSDFNLAFYARFVEYLVLSAKLRNTTAMKNWKQLKWFLRWADKNGYIKNKDYLDFNPHLKNVRDKEVVFLTWDELMKVYNLHFPDNKKYLAHVRDVFCFQCFTSLRYSDVAKLKREDIAGDVVKVVTAKTGDTLKIDLNKYSRAILEKYKDCPRPLPVISNQRMNIWLKDVCYLAGIDEPITLVYYRGAERIEEMHPKYELIGTHTGRRTFICNALTMGIPAATVMEWTGHSDYKAMKPYIKIADEEKAKAMKLFDER